MLAVADGIIFGCPTHMGGPSWQLKRFADTTIRVWTPTLRRDKPAGGFTNSAGMSGDKFSTLTYFWTLAMQHGMAWIGSGMKPAIAYDKAAHRESLNYIGGYGAMATNPLDDPPGHVTGGPGHRSGVRAALRDLPGRRKNSEHPTSTSPKTNATTSSRTPAPVEARIESMRSWVANAAAVSVGVEEVLDAVRFDAGRRGGLCGRGASGLGVARAMCSVVVGEESDAGKGHLDRGGHVVDVSAGLGQHVAALQGGDQTGGQLIWISVAAQPSAGLHPPQCRGDQAAPFGEVAGQLDAGVLIAVGHLGDHGPQHTAERSASLPVGGDQVVAPRVEAGHGGDLGQLLALIREQCVGPVIKDGTHEVFLVGKVLVKL
jgi:hypothetical protein